MDGEIFVGGSLDLNVGHVGNRKMVMPNSLDSHRGVNGVEIFDCLATIILFVIYVPVGHSPRFSRPSQLELGEFLHNHERIALRREYITITETVVKHSDFEVDEQPFAALLTHLDNHLVVIIAHIATFAPRSFPSFVMRRTDGLDKFKIGNRIIIGEHKSETRILENSLPIIIHAIK